MNRDEDAPSPYFGDYPDGAYWSAERPAETDGTEREDHTVKGRVLRLMWDYGVVVPLWDAQGQLPEEPRWLRTTLGLSDELIAALAGWGSEMNLLDGAGAELSPAEWTARYAEANTEGRSLAAQVQRELGSRFEVRFDPW